jgi:membrane protein
MKAITVWNVFKLTFSNWQTHKANRLAAGIAYYTIFSLAPLLVIVVSVAGAIFGQAAAKGELSQQIQNLVGEEAVPVIQSMIEGAGRIRSGWFAWIAGAVALSIGATGVFSAVRDAFSAIWEVEQGRGIREVVQTRFVSFLVIIAAGLLLVASLIASTGLSVAVRLAPIFPGLSRLFGIANFFLSFVVVAALFAVMYKMISQVKLNWGDVWTGAVLSSLLFSVGKFLLGVYLVRGRMGSAYGAASSLIVLLFWIYFSAQIFLFGAEFIRVFGSTRSERATLPSDREDPTNPPV